MRIHYWLNAGVLGLLITGCAGMQSGVSSETRAAVAPTGKLRVAFISAPQPLLSRNSHHFAFPRSR